MLPLCFVNERQRYHIRMSRVDRLNQEERHKLAQDADARRTG